MKFISFTSDASREELVSALGSSEAVNAGVMFNEKQGTPVFKLRKKGDTLYVSAEYVGGEKKDNGFLVGTYFVGKVSERDGRAALRGIVTTAPIYHLGLFILFVYFICKCISLGGFSPVPVILLGFSLFLFKDEFKKQGLIKRFIERARRYAERNKGKK